jgi:hypothetical protein
MDFVGKNEKTKIIAKIQKVGTVIHVVREFLFGFQLFFKQRMSIQS